MRRFNEAVSRLEYRDASGRLVGAMAALADHHEIFNWAAPVQYIEGSDETRAKILTEVDAAAIPAANEAVAAAKAQILQAARSMAGRPQGDCIAALCCGRWHCAVERKSARIWCKTPTIAAEGDALAGRLESWFYLYRQEWTRRAGVSATPNLIRLFCAWADCLRHRAYGSVHAPEVRS